MLLYIHIPFCTSKCGYCAFTSFVGEEAYFEAYIQALCEDLKHALANKIYYINSIFIGGGTPNLLSPKYYESIFNILYKNATIAEDCEISIEANINHLDTQWCKDLSAFGVNRLSVGVQSFNQEKLHFLERDHSVKDIFHSIANAYNAGFSNISCDLIINTPLDCKQLIYSEITQALDLPIEHISVYALSIDEGSHFAHRGQKNENTQDEELSFYVRDLLSQRGFAQYEVSNYAKANRECRHNIGYWQGREYLGCGAGAVGRLGLERTKAFGNLKQYLQDPTGRHREQLGFKDLEIERIMLGLRCVYGVDMSIFDKYQKTYLSYLLEGRKCYIRNDKDISFLCANELFLGDEIALWLLSRIQ